MRAFLYPVYNSGVPVRFGKRQKKRLEPSVGARPPSGDPLPSKKELKRLYRIFRKVAQRDTGYDPKGEIFDGRKKISFLVDYCYVAAWLVNERYGGLMVKGDVEIELNGQKMTEAHYWNEFSGQEVDLTSCQYGGDGYHALDSIDEDYKRGVLDGGVDKLKRNRIVNVTSYQTQNQVKRRIESYGLRKHQFYLFEKRVEREEMIQSKTHPHDIKNLEKTIDQLEKQVQQLVMRN